MKCLEIQKYGGTSMADAAAIQQSGSVVANSHEAGKTILVVASAMSGVTDQLSSAVQSAVKGAHAKSLLGSSGSKHEDTFRNIAQRTHELIDNVVESAKTGRLHQMVDDRIAEAGGYIETMMEFKLLSPMLDWICARLGEGFAAPIFSAHLQGAGVDARYYDADTVFVTDSNYGNANPRINSTRDKIKDTLVRDLNKGRVVVMGGYYGADKDGILTTFSRGGSDLSATAMGHILTPLFNPVSVYLYKADVAGVMSADPGIVVSPHVIAHMLYEEAAALTAMGGNVIHPKAVHQAVRSGGSKRLPFPIYVKSTIDPHSAGTMIDNQERPEDDPIKAISLIKDAVTLEIRGWGMDRPGIMRKISEPLALGNIDIDFISQPHSKLALMLAFQYGGKEADLEGLIREGLKNEIKANDVDMVRVKRVGVIGVIGRGISNPLILGRVIDGMNGNFPELKEPNAYRLTTGEFEASILVDLSEERLKELVQSIHDSVFRTQDLI